jgi:hypothetical protein
MRSPAGRVQTLIFFIAVCSSAGASEVQHSTSSSRQFVIYGLDTRSRGAISELAEQTKSNLLGLLRRSDDWMIPIVVNLQSPQANLPEIPAAALHFSQTGAGLKLQVDLIVSDQIDPQLIERQLLRAILLEMIYRREGNLAEGTRYVEPPNWLIEGLLALEPGRDHGAITETLAVSMSKMSLQDFLQLRAERIDAATRQLYRAYSFALLRLLIDTPDGEARLGRYIDNLSRASNDPLADLASCFPQLSGPDVSKTWELYVRRLTAGGNYQFLTFGETEAKLAEMLGFKGPMTGHAAGEVTLVELSHGKLSTTERELLAQFSANLLMLAPRSHPVLRPIVEEYQQIAAKVAAGKHRHAVERLAQLGTTRAKLIARMDQIDDYLNWFEATQLQTNSGLFHDYLKASAHIPGKPPRRNDPLSVYLDALETEF